MSYKHLRKKITLGQFFDAMEKNGYKKAKRQYFDTDDPKKATMGCAVGQAALNLGVVSATALADSLDRISIGLMGSIFYDNDATDKRIPTIAKKYRRLHKDSLDKTLGSFIVRRET